MADPRSFRDLKVWQEAFALADDVAALVEAFPPEYAFLADQMRRASRSVHANIAEGNGKSSRRDYVRFLYDARGSLQELESDVEFMIRRALVSRNDGDTVRKRIGNVGRLLNALIRALKPPA